MARNQCGPTPAIPRQTPAWPHPLSPTANASTALHPCPDVAPSPPPLHPSPQGSTEPEEHEQCPFYPNGSLPMAPLHLPVRGLEPTFSLSAPEQYRHPGQALALAARTCNAVTASPCSKAVGRGAPLSLPFTLVPFYNATVLGQLAKSMASRTAAGSRGLPGGLSPFCPRRMAFSPQCPCATEALVILTTELCLPWVPRSSPFPNTSPHALPGCLPREHFEEEEPTQVPEEAAKQEWMSLFSCCLLFLSPLK